MQTLNAAPNWEDLYYRVYGAQDFIQAGDIPQRSPPVSSTGTSIGIPWFAIGIVFFVGAVIYVNWRVQHAEQEKV